MTNPTTELERVLEMVGKALLEAMRDAERLDWLERNMHLVTQCGGKWFSVSLPATLHQADNLRAAIDAARQQENGQKKRPQ